MAVDLLDHTDRVDAYTGPPLALRDNVLSRRTLRDAFQALRARLRSFSPYGTACSHAKRPISNLIKRQI
jgi:hypothetical protein